MLSLRSSLDRLRAARPLATALPPVALLVAVLALGAPTVAAQAPVASLRSGAWNDATLWSTGSVPTATSAVTIAAGHKVEVMPATAPIASLVVEAGAIVQRYSGADGLEVLTVLGDATNRGTIHPFNMDADLGYDRLGLRVGGNVVNEGVWDAEFTELTSAGVQTLTFGSAPANTVNRRWTDTTPASSLVAGSDLRVAAGGTIQLGGGTLQLGARRLALQQTSGVTALLGSEGGQPAGRIATSGGTIEALVDPGRLADGISLWNVRIEGAATLAGYHNLGESVTVAGALTIATGAVLQRFSGQDGVRDLVVEGDVTNRGTIRPFNTNADVGYDRLALRVSGNIVNEGTWEAESTTLTGANAQTITRRARRPHAVRSGTSGSTRRRPRRPSRAATSPSAGASNSAAAC